MKIVRQIRSNRMKILLIRMKQKLHTNRYRMLKTTVVWVFSFCLRVFFNCKLCRTLLNSIQLNRFMKEHRARDDISMLSLWLADVNVYRLFVYLFFSKHFIYKYKCANITTRFHKFNDISHYHFLLYLIDNVTVLFITSKCIEFTLVFGQRR